MLTAATGHQITRPERPRVVALVRVSSSQQAADDRGGVPRQRTVIQETIRSKNLDCLNVFEISVSGTDVLRNPKVIEILEMIRSGVASGLVVADLDRLFRPTEPTDYAILQVFKDTDATIYSGDVEYRLGTKDGQLLSGIRSAVSAFEIQLSKERQRGACEEQRRRGRSPTNRLTEPVGTTFNRTTQKWEWTAEAAIVSEVFRLVDEEGERNYSKLGKQFGVSGQTIRNWLRNPIYTGWRIWKQKRGEKRVSRTGKVYRLKVDRAEEDVIRVRVLDPLITEERFQRVQKVAEEIVFNHIERLKRDETINFGTGISVCGYCGERLYCSSGKSIKGKKAGYYGCRANYYLFRERLGGCTQRNLPKPTVDELIEGFACQTLTSPKSLTGIIEASLQRTAEIVRPFPTTDQQALKRREKRLVDAYEAGEIELEDLRRRREELRRVAAVAERAGSEQHRRQEFDLEQFVRMVVRGAHRLRRISDRKEKKEIIHALLESVTVKDDGIVSFTLRADLRTALETQQQTADAPIHLATPFRLRPAKEELPPGTTRCLHCEQVLPTETFRAGSNRCHPCVATQMRSAYERRKATAKQQSNGSST